MSLRHGLLGLLAGKPMSGYELTQTFDSSLSFVWSASHSQIYPELGRLLEDGLIRQVESGPRGRKTYAITPKGRREIRTWLLESEPDRSNRSESSLRFFFLWQLDPEEAEHLLHKEREYHRLVLERYTQMARGGVDAPWGPLPLQLGITYERAMLRWLAHAIEEFSKRKV